MTHMDGVFDQFDCTFDLCCETASSIHYAICFTARSGSHYLGHLLYSTGVMGCPLEYFLHLERWEELAGSAGGVSVIEYIKSRRTSPNGCVGFKAEFSRALLLPFLTIPSIPCFPIAALFSLIGTTFWAQAISLVRARQTGQWISLHDRRAEPRYDFDAISAAVLDLLGERVSWLRYFATTGRDFLKVNYESLAKDPVAGVAAVARFVGVEVSEIRFNKVLPQKQSGEDSARWRLQFLQDARTSPAFSVCQRLSLTTSQV